LKSKEFVQEMYPGRVPGDPIREAQRQWREHGWAGAADGMAAVTSIMRAQQIYLTRVDAVLRPFALTFARYELLTLLSFTRTGSLPLGKIGARLQVHPASVTNAVDRLERDGLVTRQPHPSDGRMTLARITPKGRRLSAKATLALNAAVFEAPGLEPGETRTLTRLLESVRRGAGDLSG
jgi:DNA-binding MarR family transcriptional regulator